MQNGATQMQYGNEPEIENTIIVTTREMSLITTIKLKLKLKQIVPFGSIAV